MSHKIVRFRRTWGGYNSNDGVNSQNYSYSPSGINNQQYTQGQSISNAGWTYQNSTYQTQNSPQPTKKGYTSTGEKTLFFCPECGAQSVICVKSASNSAQKRSFYGSAFKKMKYSGSICDLACSQCGASFPSQETWSRMLGSRRAQLKMMVVFFIILLIAGAIMLISGAQFGLICIVLGALLLIGAILSVVAAIVLNSKIKSEENDFKIHGRKLNGINIG